MEGRHQRPVPKDVILANVRHNIRRGLPQVRFYRPNKQAVALIGGGPSLNDPDIAAELRGNEILRRQKAIPGASSPVALNGGHDAPRSSGGRAHHALYRPASLARCRAKQLRISFRNGQMSLRNRPYEHGDFKRSKWD